MWLGPNNSRSTSFMSVLKDPNTFADPEDSKLVADAKKIVPDPVLYNYTEVSKIHLLSFDIP